MHARFKKGNTYETVKHIKVHTKPIVISDVIQMGEFVKESIYFYIFNGFRIHKENLIEYKLV